MYWYIFFGFVVAVLYYKPVIRERLLRTLLPHLIVLSSYIWLYCRKLYKLYLKPELEAALQKEAPEKKLEAETPNASCTTPSSNTIINSKSMTNSSVAATVTSETDRTPTKSISSASATITPLKLKDTQFSPFFRDDVPMSLKPLESTDPKWMLDENVKECCSTECKRIFNLVRRRHHCRFCGKIFCNKCTKNSIKGYRACLPCFELVARHSNARGLGALTRNSASTNSPEDAKESPAPFSLTSTDLTEPRKRTSSTTGSPEQSSPVKSSDQASSEISVRQAPLGCPFVDLSGTYPLDTQLSEDFGPILEAYGISWILRGAASKAFVTLVVTHTLRSMRVVTLNRLQNQEAEFILDNEMRPLFTPVGDKPTRAYRTEAGVFSFTEFNDTMHVLVDRFLETRDGERYLVVDTRIIPRANAASLSRDDKKIVDGSTKASISPPRSGPPSAASSPKFPARGSPSLRAPVASFGHDGPLAPEEPEFRHMLLEPDGLDAIRAQDRALFESPAQVKCRRFFKLDLSASTR